MHSLISAYAGEESVYYSIAAAKSSRHYRLKIKKINHVLPSEGKYMYCALRVP